MSEFRFNRLNRYRLGGSSDELRLAVPLPKSPTGKVHRRCPQLDCIPRVFQLGQGPQDQQVMEELTPLTRRPPKSPGVTCPYCGHDGRDEDFLFPEDVEAIKGQILWAVTQDVADFFEEELGQLNASQRQASPIRIEMSVRRPGHLPPMAHRQDLLRDLTCDFCGRRYGVYAIGLFCPDCGARNIHVHFQREMELVAQQIQLAEAMGKEGKQELAYRLLGNAHEDVLTAFETYLKTIFRFLVKHRLPARVAELTTKQAIGNRFQNIARGQKLFAEVNVDPYQGLSPEDLEFLRMNIEKRHVLGHNLGVADEEYTRAVGKERPGRTVTLLSREIQRFAATCQAVIVYLEQSNPEFLPPSV